MSIIHPIDSFCKRPNRTFFLQLLSFGMVVFVLGFTQPAAEAKNPDGRGGERSIVYYDTSDLPIDVGMVLAEVVGRLRGDTPAKDDFPVSFSEEALNGLKLDGYQYKGFAVTSVIMGEYGIVETDPLTMRLDMYISMMDAARRKALVGLLTEYRLTEKEVLVSYIKSAPIYPASPDVKMFFVPVDIIPDDFLSKMGNHRELLEFVIKRNTQITKTGDYYIFAFLMDRVEEDAVVSLLISNTPQGISGALAPTSTLYNNGWIVAIGKLQVPPNAKGNMYYKVVYGGGAHKPEALQKPRMIGSFPTRAISRKKRGSYFSTIKKKLDAR